MKGTWKLVAVVMTVAVLAAGVTAWAAGRDVKTTIMVKGLHCDGCAKRLVAKLNAVPGVKSSQADAKKGIAVVIPGDQHQLPSPRAQWEAVEQAGYQPTKLVGPFGTFDKKPRS